jgi:hypothetical protein
MNRIAISFPLIAIIVVAALLVQPAGKGEAAFPLVAIVVVSGLTATTASVSLFYLGQAFPAAWAEIPWKKLLLSKPGDDKSYFLVTESKKTADKLKEELAKKLIEKASKTISKIIKKSFSNSVRIGADASPTANYSNPKFIYRDYGIGSFVSRWDFYPPTRTTINDWYVDTNKDGKTDQVISFKIQGFFLK